jgi:hypothetical protein
MQRGGRGSEAAMSFDGVEDEQQIK